MPSQEAPDPIEVPYGELSAELLNAVIESFVLREGTDYGEREFSLEDKVARRGRAKRQIAGSTYIGVPWVHHAH
jgi:uncharacterized protein YheU (UPF0270 family)